MKHAAFALLLAAVACAPGDGKSSADGAAEREAAHEGVDGMSAIYIPAKRKYRDQLQVRIVIPSEYVWPRGSDQSARGLKFRPINYVTKKPSNDLSSSDGDIVSFMASPEYFPDNSGIQQFYERFDDIGEERFGLSYRPQPVPGRPEDLWQRVYLKTDVPGEKFHISCIPPIAPGSILPPTECTMNLMVAPRQFGDRRAGLGLKVSVPLARMADWRKIESAIVELIEPRVEWIGGAES